MSRLSLSSRLGRSGLIVISTAAIVAVALILTIPKGEAPADLREPTANDRRVTLLVKTFLKDEHLLQKPVDDEVAQRALKTFIKNLDPMKLYFLESDVAELKKETTTLDDLFLKGDIRFAYRVYNLFMDRLEKRVAVIDKLLDQDFDFDKDEDIITDPDATVFAKSQAESDDRWRKRIKFDMLVFKLDEVEEDEARKRLKRRYSSYLRRMKQFKSDDLLEMYLSAFTTALDPHTTYMSPSSLENFRISMKLNLEGIGAALQMTDGYTVVTKIIPGGAADKAGQLKPEDRIVSVGQGIEGDMVDVIDMNLNDVVSKIRGKAGTYVRLGVQPAGTTDSAVYTIKRAKIELKDSEARGEIFEQGKKANGDAFKVGVIDLPSFYQDMVAAGKGQADFKSTTADVVKILKNFKENGVDAVVLRLDRNGGGSLTEAINLTGLFIKQGPVVQVKDPEGRVRQYNDRDPNMYWDGPLVVVTSKFSASASEILAGAIKDYGRGIIIGDETTHGKGTVQSLLDLGTQFFRVQNPPNLGALKITMQQFYRPNGDSTQKRGVLSDIVLPSITNWMDVGESDLPYAVEFDNVRPANFGNYSMVSKDMVEQLTALSKTRRAESEDFAKRLENINKYREQKQRKTVTLNEKEFLEEREEMNADKEEEKQFKDQVAPDETKIERDFYLEEVMSITREYAEMLGKQEVARK